MPQIKLKPLLETFTRHKIGTDIEKGDTVTNIVDIKVRRDSGIGGFERGFTKKHIFTVTDVDDQYNTLNGYTIKDKDGNRAYVKPNQIKLVKKKSTVK